MAGAGKLEDLETIGSLELNMEYERHVVVQQSRAAVANAPEGVDCVLKAYRDMARHGARFAGK